MKVILFGGTETGEVATELAMIEKAIKKERPKQVLHIPFARITTNEVEWQGDWYHRNISHPGIEYLNAENKKDMAKVKKPLVFISGGSSIMNLEKKLKRSPKLVKIIKNASCIIGESAGAKILCPYFREKGNDPKSKMVKGLNIIKDTVLEAHYFKRNKEKSLVRGMEETGVSMGLGIDSLGAIELDTKTWPKKWKSIGTRKIIFKRK